MKIVHVAIRFPPATGGGEQVVYNLAKHQVKKGNQVHVITTDLLKELPRKVDKNLPRKEIHHIMELALSDKIPRVREEAVSILSELFQGKYIS